MTFINYISNIAVPFTILIIIVYGLIEKQSVFDIFLLSPRDFRIHRSYNQQGLCFRLSVCNSNL